MIVQQGMKFLLYTQDGSKLLGEHDSYEEAEAQEKAIEASKAKRSALKKMKGA